MPTKAQLDQTFINVAKEFAKLSKCVSYQVGAVLVKDGRIVSTGYNGTISGAENCCEHFDKDNFEREEHSKWSDIHEIHAEMNCLLFAARNGINVQNSVLYCTHQPCWQCLKNIINAGVERVVYCYPYDRVNDKTYECFKPFILIDQMQ